MKVIKKWIFITEWNQYIFSTTDSLDITKKNMQENLEVYDSSTSEAIYVLFRDKIIYQDDKDNWFYK